MSEKLVIVADDDPTICYTIKRYLSRLGFQVKTLADGFEVLLACLYLKPALIITDIRMPRLDGMYLLEGLRNNVQTKDIPVILISALRNEDLLEKAKKLGAASYLVKPFQLDELHKAVSIALCQEYMIDQPGLHFQEQESK